MQARAVLFSGLILSLSVFSVSIVSAPAQAAVAKVYETDIIHVKAGQKAQITSPALPGPQTGTVESIGLKVGRMDVLGMDPVAQADARAPAAQKREHASKRCWTMWAWRTISTSTPTPSPAARSNGWALPAPWPMAPK